jgi:hypothetical protein
MSDAGRLQQPEMSANDLTLPSWEMQQVGSYQGAPKQRRSPLLPRPSATALKVRR